MSYDLFFFAGRHSVASSVPKGLRRFKGNREAVDLCVRPANAGAGWNGKEPAMFGVVQGEAVGLGFARVLVPHPQASILEESVR
jgi:hypothetical protein